MAQSNDSVVERAHNVQFTLQTVGDTTAQVAVGGPRLRCGARIETVLHTDTHAISCQTCGRQFRVAA